MRLLDLFKPKKIKVGLALGGGGARGFTHIGVIKAFEEHGIKFDAIAGTSVGSLVGAFYAAGYTYQELYKIAQSTELKDIKSSKMIFVPSKTEGIERVITENLGDINIEDLAIPFTAVAVDLKTTEEVHLKKGNLAKAVAGSCAVPGIFHPVEHEGMHLVDGGLRNNLPSNVLKMLDCDYVVAVDINKSRGYGTDSTKVMDVLACAIRILTKSNTTKGYLYADVVVKPETKRFKATSKEGFEEMIEEGYKEAISQIEAIKDLFKGKKLSKRKRNKIITENKKFFV